ncbi:MAG TPA: lysine--tRNA ligase [Planctomycetota bacterium]|nr:lysine--tRNA ligase [Planctomycetota bacterium]
MTMAADQLAARLEKLSRLRAEGIDPYPYRYERTHTTGDLEKNFDTLAQAATVVKTFGRLMLWRKMGKSTFGHIQDQAGRFQIFLNHDTMGEAAYTRWTKNLDIADIIGVSGTLFTTKTGEKSLRVTELTMLCKSLHNLPDKQHGYTNEELRQRHREMDILVNEDSRRAFLMRSKIVTTARQLMVEHGYSEVDVPVLQTVYGGAEARPFTTHVQAIDTDVYLSIAPETYLKRYLVGGFDRAYFIGKNFRNEGIDRTHHPEFSCFEGYAAGMDYNDLMVLVETLISQIALRVTGSTQVEYHGQKIELKPPWRRIRMMEALREKLGTDPMALSQAECERLLKEANVEFEPKLAKGYLLLKLFDHHFEAGLIQPAFVMDYPEETSPLCKPHRTVPGLIERFEGYLNGWEICNCYSELNDPQLQRKLLERQVRMLEAGLEQGTPMDEDFAFAIELGMPPTGGFGIGLDRICMLLSGARAIQDVLAYPLLRPSQGRQVEDESSAAAIEGGAAESGATGTAAPGALPADALAALHKVIERVLLKQNKKADALTDADIADLAPIVCNVARKKGGLPAPLETMLADDTKPLIPIVAGILKAFPKAAP